MKKVLLYFPTEIQKQENTSVYEKFKSQIIGFEKNNCEVDYIYHNQYGILLNDHEIRISSLLFFFRFPLIKKIIGYYLVLLNSINFKQYNLVYIRYKTSNPFILILLKKVRKQNPFATILIEFPTFPYHAEFTPLLYRIYFYFERKLSMRLKRYVNYVVSFGNFENIYQIKSINISNGYNYELEKRVVLPSKKSSHEQLVLLGMASYLEFWHGYDRILYGIRHYIDKVKNPCNILFKIIGRGPEIEVLKSLATQLGIEKNIIISGYLNDAEIIEMMHQCDIGIGPIAMHRKQLDYDSSLKSRYFTFMGLPFILAAKDNSFLNTMPYWYYVKADDTPIDIEKLISFLKNLEMEHPNYTQEMNKYAKENLSWQSQVKFILDSIES